MTLRQLNESELLKLASLDIGRIAILFMTPMCGTCKVASRMLEVAEAAGVDYPVAAVNINFTPRFREEWQIASVPCLVLLKNGKLLRKEYAMRSAQHLYAMMKE